MEEEEDDDIKLDDIQEEKLFDFIKNFMNKDK
jgi:hypothetical protein